MSGQTERSQHARSAVTRDIAVIDILACRCVDFDRRGFTRLDNSGMDIQFIDIEVVRQKAMIDDRQNDVGSCYCREAFGENATSFISISRATGVADSPSPLNASGSHLRTSPPGG